MKAAAGLVEPVAAAGAQAVAATGEQVVAAAGAQPVAAAGALGGPAAVEGAQEKDGPGGEGDVTADNLVEVGLAVLDREGLRAQICALWDWLLGHACM